MSVASSDHPTGNVGVPAVSNHIPVPLRSDESTVPSAVADEGKLDWKSTVSSTAKLLLHGVSNSADAFGPLKSVAGGLCFVLDNCEVWTSISRVLSYVYRCPSERRQILKPLNHWHPESRLSLSYSVHLFPRVISRRDRGGRSWKCKPILSANKSWV